MRLRPLRALLTFTTLSSCAAFAVPAGAQTAGPGAEFTIAGEMPAPVAGPPCLLGTDGSNFAVFQGCAQPLTAQRLSPSGTLLDPVAVSIPFADGSPLLLAPATQGYLIAWNPTKFNFPLMSHLDANLAPVEAEPG
ncbi:MAG TPA: hypothetical protein VGI39_16250, partial [Polyangiaceae bacterium]